MSKNYEDMSLEELEALKKERLIKDLRSQDENENDKEAASPKILSDANLSKDADVNEEYSWIIKKGIQDYENMFTYTDSDANCPADYSNWTPSEFFSNYILHAVAADTPLLDLVKMKVDVGAGNGDTVRFRHIDARTAQSTTGGCDCMSCASNSMTNTDITIGRFGDFTILCEFDLWQSKDVKEETLKAMGKGAARYVNSEIHDAITEATPGYDVNMGAVFDGSSNLAGSCCTNHDAYQFYVACVDLVQQMIAAGYSDLYSEGVWLMHPSVAALLKYPSGQDVPFWMRGSTDVKDGKLVKLLGIEVREDPLGQALSTDAATVFAYLIHKQRSIGLAWGKKPTFFDKYDGQCDSWEIGYNAYFGVDSIEDGSIGTISSP